MLDAIRVSASFLVAFGHFSQPAFSAGWRSSTGAAVDTVAVFFVLSGFVIRYVTCRRRGTLPEYLRDRASRIFSVALPALLLTMVFASIAAARNPAFYAPWSHPEISPLISIVVNLVFCGQLWHLSVDPLCNLPYWSINYEVAFYLIYACYFYLTGAKRWIYVAAVCLFFGPRILYLFPLWIAGCVAHDVYQRWNAEGRAAVRINRLLLFVAIVAAGASALIVGLHLVPQTAHAYAALDALIGPQKLTLRAYLLGLLWTLIFLPALLFARRFPMAEDSGFTGAIRFISEGTFPIYLLHYPMFIVIAACIPYDHGSMAQTSAIFVGVLVAGILAGHPCNLLKLKLRTLFSRIPAVRYAKVSS